MKRNRYNSVIFENPYKTENELCDVLIAHAKDNGWKVFPETSGFDLLLVKDIQIGVQAKLKDNIKVLAQALEGRHTYGNTKWTFEEPNLRAVLVPNASNEFMRVAGELGIFVIIGSTLSWDFSKNTGAESYWAKSISPYTTLNKYNRKYLIIPKSICWVPEVEIIVPAGVKSPKEITPWKIKAVRLCLELEKKGFLTSKDFKDMKVHIALWRSKRWLLDSGFKDGKLVKYVKNPSATLPDELYPEITSALKRAADERDEK